ncbi:P-loop containing nucleoside triphosphate hydrolase [Pseudocohnilembus persalinus]|uniref:p-loop containing nucleoside triphosphate hydrolase n=1 Tax=Pseudocohnilembus persalinus TaxID=266149 RepID=A0A0V0Q9C0_PSEPJ|nr:P-loop containing nucleoside triphosphate hydrolase [Pseudocohnilembus persalinus]|eukprot:KRW98762.1 P-loop containing nucleoside triphosphate hydrolase [Pseudocohnilembus persalinus]
MINKDERAFMFLGGICSFTAGTCYPVSAIFLGELLYILISYGYIPDEEFRKKRDENALGFVIIAIVSFISNCLQFASWKKVGEGLTFKLRKLGFQKILNMRASWLDEPENSPGTLSSRLGSDTQIVNGITSTVVNIQISNLGALVSGLCIGFIYEWRTTLVALGCFPIIAVAGALQAKFVQGFSEQTDAGYKNSGNLIQEAVINMRTVISFGNQDAFLKSYDKRLELPQKIIEPKAHNAGFFFGLSQFLQFITYGLVIFIGAVFVKEFGVDTKNMYIAVFSVMNAAVGAGNNNAFMTDIGTAYNAAKNLLNLLDEKDENQLHKEEIFDPISDFSKFKGEIEFKDVVFKYPTRNKYVLNGISFKISPGQKCAFVGPSGCGKSTIMQILLRFYEIEAGSISIDGLDYKKYDIQGLRAQYGFVGQEPILFQGTIKENIIYNTQNTTQSQLDLVAEQANAKKFIENNEFEGEIDEKQNLGQGYNRQVGSKGNFLSGGQKQRIAIARAIIKQPKILLLDEATSALDNKNEQLVQQSLDKLMEGKTTLSIAHRISTIKDSDQIFVFEAGLIVEKGKYQDLIAKKGYFYRLERGDIK